MADYTERQTRRLDANQRKYEKATKSSERAKYFRRDVQMRKNYDLINSKRVGYNSRVGVSSVLALVMFILLAISAFRLLNNGEPIQLSTFLSQVAGAPTIPTDWLQVLDTSFGSSFPSWLQWLGSIFDFFVDIFEFSLFTSTAALNAVIFIFYFLRWLFL